MIVTKRALTKIKLQQVLRNSFIQVALQCDCEVNREREAERFVCERERECANLTHRVDNSESLSRNS